MAFYIPVDLSRTALLLADIQGQIAGRLPQDEGDALTDNVLDLLTLFRTEISRCCGDPATIKAAALHSGLYQPIQQTLQMVQSLEAAGHFDRVNTDPNQPNYQILQKLVSESGWGSKDEVILRKLTASCFGSSELMQYLRARDIKHVILCGLTTVEAVLGTARAGAL